MSQGRVHLHVSATRPIYTYIYMTANLALRPDRSSRNPLSNANNAPSTHRRTSPPRQRRPYEAASRGMNRGAAANLDPSSSSAAEAGQQSESSSSPMNAPGTNDGVSATAPALASPSSLRNSNSAPSRSSSSSSASSSAYARGATRSRHDSVVEAFSPSTITGPKSVPRTVKLTPQTLEQLMAMQNHAISDSFALD